MQDDIPLQGINARQNGSFGDCFSAKTAICDVDHVEIVLSLPKAMENCPVIPLKMRGFEIYKSYLTADQQAQIVADMRNVAAAAPMFSPMTRFGKPMSVKMTSAGKYGWYSDNRGYRYIDTHPSGSPWPAMPRSILDIWDQLVGGNREPDCCLMNLYSENTKMGMHQDRDEADFSHPVVSISLGDDGLFRIGNTTKGGKTKSIWLSSGDVVIMGGDARLTYHGIDRIKFGTSRLLSSGGRLNITLRVVD